jgi:hypothetical protein
MEIVGRHFRPEFINRVDEVMVFHPSVVSRPIIVDPGNWTTGLDRMPRFRPGDRRGKKDV